MEIGNIVSKQKINVGPEFNVVEDMDDIIFNELPTLIIGYDLVNTFFGKDSINILKRRIGKHVFWTLKRKTKRDVYSNDLEDFIRYSYEKYTKKINYVNLDLIHFSNKKIIKIIKKIYSLDKVITYKSKNDVLFLHSNDLIFGIDLNLVKFVGFDPKKIEKKVIEKSDVFLKGEEILIEYANHLERLNHDVKYIPCLYLINPT
tara:strand:- start:691 stop:1299 length:609 start_codon:yes stop_codon:yes gene_type:complete